MTAQEAIKILSELHDQCCQADSIFCTDTTGARCEAVDVAISALEKQIPKKPTVPVDTWLCPSCGEPVEYQQKFGDNVLYHGQHDFCPKCGQKICWEDE